MIRVIASFMTLPRRPCNEEVTLIRVIATFMKLPRRPCNKEVTIIHVIASFMTLPTRPCNKEVTLMQLINKTNVWSEFIHDDDVIYNIKSKLINYSSFIKLAMLCIYNVFIYNTIHPTYFYILNIPPTIAYVDIYNYLCNYADLATLSLLLGEKGLRNGYSFIIIVSQLLIKKMFI